MSGLHSQHRYEKLTREELSRNLEEKDQVIGKQARDIAGLEQQLQHMRHKNQELDDRNSELQSKLEIELQHTELKSKVKELERIRKELVEKDKKNENLRLAIDKLNERMQ
jgi:predicted RNase H-like nuclease (RuvC/YqgF family)